MQASSRKPRQHSELPEGLQYSDSKLKAADKQKIRNYFSFVNAARDKTRAIRSAYPDAYSLFTTSPRFKDFVSSRQVGLLSRDQDLNTRYSVQGIQEDQGFIQSMYAQLERMVNDSRGLPIKRLKESEAPHDWMEQFDLTFKTIKAASLQRRAKFRQDLANLRKSNS
jgi:hypothetical protein